MCRFVLHTLALIRRKLASKDRVEVPSHEPLNQFPSEVPSFISLDGAISQISAFHHDEPTEN
jgi:hypothetical protein